MRLICCNISVREASESFIGGGNQSTQRKPLTNFITQCFIEYTTLMSGVWTHNYSDGSWIYNYLCNQCLSPPMLWVRISIRARCTTLCDKVFQWLATGRWFSPGPPVASTNKTDHHDITFYLLRKFDMVDS